MIYHLQSIGQRVTNRKCCALNSREVFKVLILNRKNELITDQDVFFGSLSGSAVYLREIVTLALEQSAAAMVFVHNHPSGDPAPAPHPLSKLIRDRHTGEAIPRNR